MQFATLQLMQTLFPESKVNPVLQVEQTPVYWLHPEFILHPDGQEG